ncbi:MAG: DUF3810 domain-containing protein [Atopobiaceae bacterium]|nr:DUF3810 domain-containing protein [Atopobiaceae bacterium]
MRRRFVAAGLLLVCCLVMRVAFARFGAALFPGWRVASKGLVTLQATVASVVPVAIWDIALALGIVASIVFLVRNRKKRDAILSWLSWVCLAGSTMAVLFVFWAFNHYAPPLAHDLGLEVRAYSTDELADATQYYLDRAAQMAPEVSRESDGGLAHQDFFELARIAGSAYGSVAGSYEVFRGPQLPVKALLLWGEPLLYSGHTGIFWAPTGESGVPLNCPDADLPFIMCHEAAHRLGIADEGEANFAAFLACEASQDERLAYSGYFNAFSYCFSALYGADPDRAVALVNEAAEGELGQGVYLLFSDRAATRERYDSFRGPFQEVGTAVNDTYLKSFGESSGVRSYGLVVDYLIAWYQASA